MIKRHRFLLICATVFFASCSQKSSHGGDGKAGDVGDASSQAQGANSASAALSAPASLAQCKACHTFSREGGNGVGPRLFGVVGRKVGSEEGYTYSEAMVQSGLTWSPEQLDRFLQSPKSLVPGTKMSFAGISNPDERRQIVEYLSKLKN